MCGIFFTTNKAHEYDLNSISRRGPEGGCFLENDFGVFGHYSLKTKIASSQPYIGKKGVMIYNGSVYNAEDDTKYIGDNVSDNVDDCIDFIRTLNGEYAIGWVTDNFYLFATDPFRNRQLWLAHSDREVTVSSYPDTFRKKNIHCWPLPPNTICIIFKKDNSLKLFPNQIWNTRQYKKNYDELFENFEKSVMIRTSNKTCLPLSSGYDTGCIGAIWHKNDVQNTIAVDIKKTENPVVMKYRQKFHKNIIKFESKENIKMLEQINNIHTSVSLRGKRASSLITLSQSMQREKLVTFLSGDGGDEIYSDYGYNGSQITRDSYFGGCFPNNLSLVWPPPSLHIILDYTLRLDMISGYFGVEARTPFLDKNVVQSWLNTDVSLKNKGYKMWMSILMSDLKYPFAKNEKIPFKGQTYKIK